jgi:predicted CopG family antitoxin
MAFKNHKLICISIENYQALKRRGLAGDSFNDVVSQLLERVRDNHNKTDNKKDKRSLQSVRCVEALAHFATTTALSKNTAEVDPDR